MGLRRTAVPRNKTCLYVFFSVLLYHSRLHYKEERNGKNDSDRKNDIYLLNEAGNYIHNERDRRNGYSVRKLS